MGKELNIRKSIHLSPNKCSKITLNIEGMRCTHCESQVTIALYKVPGVKKVKIRKRKYVTIKYKSNNTNPLSIIIATIEHSGYSITGEKGIS